MKNGVYNMRRTNIMLMVAGGLVSLLALGTITPSKPVVKVQFETLVKNDKMSLTEHQYEFTKDVADLIIYAQIVGIKLTFGEVYRTKYQQVKYVNDGLSNTLLSLHRKRLAVDFNFFVDGKLTYQKEAVQELGDYWESLSPLNKWGGNWKSFKDIPHFERNYKGK